MPSYTTRKISDPFEQARREVELSRLGTNNARSTRILALRAIVPFGHYALSGLDYHGLEIGSGIMLASDMPEPFLREYIGRNMFRSDPLSTRLTADSNWSSWHDIPPAEREQPDLVPFRRLEQEYAVATRSFVVLRRGNYRYGGATFTRDTPFTETEKFILEAGARMIHAELSAERIAQMTAHAGLSHGEISCLKSVADGLSSDEASHATGYTAETVASYIKAATKKLGCVNRTHAAAEAVRRRLFD